MNNTLQLYVDDEKTIKGYPVTSPDRVIDENGKSVKDKLKNNVKFDVVGQGVGAPPIDGGNAELVEKVDKLEELVDGINKKNNGIEMVNIEYCGIKNDGTIYTNSDILPHIKENTPLYFNNGEYKIDNLNISEKNNITITGNKATIIFTNQSVFTDCNNITFNNVDFINSNNIYQLLSFNNCKNVKFINCNFDGKNIVRNGITFESCENIEFISCDIRNFRERLGITFMNCNNCVISSCLFENIGGPGVSFKWGNIGCYVYNSMFKNCCNYDWSGGKGSDGVIDFYGVYETYGKNLYGIVSGNTIDGFGNDAIGVNAIRVITSDYITVENNIIKGGVGSCTFLTIGDRKRASDNLLFESNGCSLSNNILILDKSVNIFIDISGKVNSCNIEGNKILNYNGTCVNEWSPSLRITQTDQMATDISIINNYLGSELLKLPQAGIISNKANKKITIKDNHIHTKHTPLSISNVIGLIVVGNWLGSELNDSSVANNTNGIIKDNIRCFNRTFTTTPNNNVTVGDIINNF